AGGLPPCIERVEPLLAFAQRAEVLPVHVDAVGAAVELRRTQTHQVQERRLQARLVEVLVHGIHGIVDAGRGVGVVEAGSHSESFLDRESVSATLGGASLSQTNQARNRAGSSRLSLAETRCMPPGGS